MSQTPFPGQARRLGRPRSAVRIVCDLGPAIHVRDFQQAVSDVNQLLIYASDLTTLLQIRDSPGGRLTWDTVGFQYGKMDEDPRGYSYWLRGPRDGRGEVSALRLDIDPRQVPIEVLYLQYRNPLETWAHLLLGGGAVGTTMFLGAFLRDFAADRRIKRAEADRAEEDVAQKRAQTRVVESQADVAVALNEGIANAVRDALGTGSTDAVEVARSAVTLGQLDAMARLANVLVSVDDVTRLAPPGSASDDS